MAKKKTITVELNRDSINGWFVTHEYAKNHPKRASEEKDKLNSFKIRLVRN